MNIGMVGTGFIAHKMAKEFTSLPTMPVVAVYSRSADTGVAMANEFHIPKVYTEYNEMLADPEVELVYIATPNSLHFEQAKAALLHHRRSQRRQARSLREAHCPHLGAAG